MRAALPLPRLLGAGFYGVTSRGCHGGAASATPTPDGAAATAPTKRRKGMTARLSAAAAAGTTSPTGRRGSSPRQQELLKYVPSKLGLNVTRGLSPENAGMLIPFPEAEALLPCQNPVETIAFKEVRGHANSLPEGLIRHRGGARGASNHIMLYKSSGLSMVDAMQMYSQCLGLSPNALSCEGSPPAKACASVIATCSAPLEKERIAEANRLFINYRRHGMGGESISEYLKRDRLSKKLEKQVVAEQRRSEQVSNLTRFVMGQMREVPELKWGDEVRLRTAAVPIGSGSKRDVVNRQRLVSRIKDAVQHGAPNYFDASCCVSAGGLSKILFNILLSARLHSGGQRVCIGDLVIPNSGVPDQGTGVSEHHLAALPFDPESVVLLKTHADAIRHRFCDVVLPVPRFGAVGGEAGGSGVFPTHQTGLSAYAAVAKALLGKDGAIHADGYRHVWARSVTPAISVTRDPCRMVEDHIWMYSGATHTAEIMGSDRTRPIPSGFVHVDMTLNIPNGVSVTNLLRHVFQKVPLAL